MVTKRLISYLKPYQKKFWFAFFLLVLSTAAEIAVPVIASHYIDHYLTPRLLDWSSIILFSALFVGLPLLGAICFYYQYLAFQTIAQWVIKNIRVDVFSRVQHLGLSFFDRHADGSLVSRITNDTEAIKELYINVLSSFMQNIVIIIGVYIGMFILEPTLAVVSLILLPAVVLLMHGYRKRSSKVYHVIRSKLSQMNAKLNESIQGMNVIQAMRQEKRLHDAFSKINQDHYIAYMKNIKLFGLLLRPATQLLSVFMTILVLNYFGIMSFSTAIPLGILYGFIDLLGRLFEPINQMMMRLSQFQQAVVSAERVFTLLDQTEYAPAQQGNENPQITQGRIEFKDVTFSYDRKTDVLKNISFVAEPGQMVALVGHTGSGKSSIVNLLMHFYPFQQGSISIDGIPLQSFRNEVLRTKIGLVLQDPFLFVGDITSNIRLHDAEITDEKVKEAAQFVQAHSFIEKLDQKYHEPVGERGATFSSGQRQLISFARTMVHDPKILVLDEATASVDTETEEAIQVALEKMRAGRTTIAIAHRLSTIKEADLILVLHKGEIVEKGTHQTLLEKEGLYHKMYLLQQGMVEIAN
ncbi:ATP-binding cassette domain-containing protein [Hazenella sp. IB182357]|uniref:ATP-binding cassette domain-containing protein n=1 Tax=Polycladospora coralii TaxID=2771432 RepID=A0A926N8F6_9BACL|nr:ABC transporter transmembrane domain-containing protein [Polycladospora coralii]MBD1371692.1 ATP-binding cassette domain-containing protein [Polycladospora coralii]MBS7529159.1 ATP-binding cassette domain-containing protein [Polycladospora coralii]